MGIVKQKRNSPGNVASSGLRNWRRGAESNRPSRICNPVHNRFATAPFHLKKKGSFRFPFLKNVEREKSLELSTSTLARLRSTN
jgi:hypothetical protein